MEKSIGKLVAFPAEVSRDALTEVLREGARQMLAAAIEAEVQGYLAAREPLIDDAGHRVVVRNGHLPARTLQTPLGEVPVRQPRVRDRRPAEDREAFQSSILPRYLRKTKSLEELLPWLYLKGVSTGDFSEALAALLGPKAPGLSATTITRLKAGWEEDYKVWQARSLAGRQAVRLHLGRWRAFQHPTRRSRQRSTMHPGADGRHRRGQKGTHGRRRRLPRE